MKYRILLVDDEAMVRSSLRRLLDGPGWGIAEAGSVAEARERIGAERFDLVVVDYKLGDGTGLEVLDHLQRTSPQTEAIMLTAYGKVSIAVEAIRKGAHDFLEKDGDPQLTRHVVDKAIERVRLRREVEELQKERLDGTALPQVIARSQPMLEVVERIKGFARTDATVLIQGETGTGKSLLAELVHQASRRADGPFVTINCGAIPKELIESELFGYAEGAFTGARQQGKMGLIERAHGGTLLLDEIGDLSLELQSKLLHVLESREFLRVGAVEPTRVDVRFIAATNADLPTRIAEGRFRSDLFYRLDVAAVTAPPLRGRPEDVLALARHFAHKLGQRHDRTVNGLTPAAEQWLTGRAWPGNVRELRNVIERAVLLLRNDSIDAADLAGSRPAGHAPAPGDARPLDGSAGAEVNGEAGAFSVSLRFGSGDDLLGEATEAIVREAWRRSSGNQSAAARLLGIPRTTFQTYVQKYELG